MAQIDPQDMIGRYAGALTCTPIMMASRTPNNSIEGYWIDPLRFYFLNERLDELLDRIVPTPSIANAQTGTVSAIITPNVLAELLSEKIDNPLTMEDLADAQYDMPDPDRLVVCVQGRAFHIDLTGPRVRELSDLAIVPELYSPSGQHSIFLKGHDVWIRDRATGSSRALTTDGEGLFAYGRNADAGLTAITSRRNPIPVGLWSRDSKWFVTHRIDERAVPSLSLIQHAPPGGGRPVMHSYRYPMPGDPRAIITFVAFNIETGRTTPILDFPSVHQAQSPFTQRAIWFSEDSEALYFIRLSRFETEADLVEVDLKNAGARIVMTERAKTGYLSFHSMMARQPNVRVLRASNEVIWYSERDNWGHLYLYDLVTGALKRQITKGDWLVRDIVHIDESQRRIFFLAGGINPDREPGQRALCAIDIDTGNQEILIDYDGDIAVAPSWPGGIRHDRPFMPPYAKAGVSPNGAFIAIERSSLLNPTQMILAKLGAGAEYKIAESDSIPGPPPVRFEVLAADGLTPLYGAIFLPNGFDKNGHYPVIDYIYPGPQVAWLPRTSRSRQEATARGFAELGFVTVIVDSRGAPYRSRAFHQAGQGNLLEPQLADHAAALAQLCKRYTFMDDKRVGMFGLSGGGYATARALFDYPEVFKVGVSACGNHDNRIYQALWLEKYSGPRSDGHWDDQQSMSGVSRLCGKLFLITGDFDENVHPANTLALVDALVKANKDFDLLIVPNAGHDLLSNAYVQRRIWDYFVRNLMGAEPPVEFKMEFSKRDILAHDRIRKRDALSGVKS